MTPQEYRRQSLKAYLWISVFLLAASLGWYSYSASRPNAFDNRTESTVYNTAPRSPGAWSSIHTVTYRNGLFLNMEWQAASVAATILLFLGVWIAYHRASAETKSARAVPTPFTFSCPHCAQHISTTTEYAGTKAKCPTCQNAIMVPTPNA